MEMCTNQRSAQSKSPLPNLILAAAQANVGLAAGPVKADVGKTAADARDDAEVQLEDADVIFEHTLVVERGEDNKRICFEELWNMQKAIDEGWSDKGLSEDAAEAGLIKHGTHCHDC